MTSSPRPDASKNKPLVAVVDDEESLRRSVRNLLRSVGYRVVSFASAEEFLVPGAAAGASCLILDLRMPGMSGLELLQHLAGTPQPIPVVVVTARAEEELRRAALGFGALAFLTKPFVPDELLAAVWKAVGQSRTT
jgi:FixJ family two-component response regulator